MLVYGMGCSKWDGVLLNGMGCSYTECGVSILYGVLRKRTGY